MPLKLDTKINEIRCSWCKKIIRGNPIVVKTCCNNKPLVFCSNSCYTAWMRQWLRRQEQIRRR